MTTFVTKKDGTRVAFDSQKIRDSVIAAALDAEMADEEADKLGLQISESITKLFSDHQDASTQEICEKIMAELDVAAPTVAESWKHYEITKEH